MIRTYSETMIALQTDFTANPRCATVRAEDSNNTKDRGEPQEVTIKFFGEIAEEASQRLVPGMRFTFRGYVKSNAEAEMTLVGVTFTPIA